MDTVRAEEMTAYVIGALAGARAPQPDLVLRLADAFPGARGLELTLALAYAANGLEAVLTDGLEQAHGLYRLATLVAVDILVLEVQGHARDGPITAAQLRAHWRGDPFFATG